MSARPEEAEGVVHLTTRRAREGGAGLGVGWRDQPTFARIQRESSAANIALAMIKPISSEGH